MDESSFSRSSEDYLPGMLELELMSRQELKHILCYKVIWTQEIQELRLSHDLASRHTITQDLLWLDGTAAIDPKSSHNLAAVRLPCQGDIVSGHDSTIQFLGVNLLSREGYSQAGDRMMGSW